MILPLRAPVTGPDVHRSRAGLDLNRVVVGLGVVLRAVLAAAPLALAVLVAVTAVLRLSGPVRSGPRGPGPSVLVEPPA